MVLVATHAHATARSDQPASRKRIRIANAVVMLLMLPMLACGFSLLDPHRHPREWTLVWIAALALLVVGIALAVLDAANTARLTLASRRRLRASLGSLSQEAAGMTGRSGRNGDGGRAREPSVHART